MSEFLILSLGPGRKKSDSGQVPSYSSIMKKQQTKKEVRSISTDSHPLPKQEDIHKPLENIAQK